MRLKEQTLKRVSPLYGFANHPVEVKGCITLPLTIGDGKHITTKYVQFFVLDHPIAYNAIFRRPIMRMTKMMIDTFSMKIKFLSMTRIGFMKFD